MTIKELSAVAPNVLDLDAAAREAAGGALQIRLGGNEFDLPPELPAATLDPLIAGDFDDVIAALAAMLGDDPQAGAADFMGFLSGALTRNPGLISGFLTGVKETLAGIFGAEQWPVWEASRPSLPDYLRLLRWLGQQYGVGLGEALGLPPASATGSPTSKPTSRAKASTRAGSGSRHGTRG